MLKKHKTINCKPRPCLINEKDAQSTDLMELNKELEHSVCYNKIRKFVAKSNQKSLKNSHSERK